MRLSRVYREIFCLKLGLGMCRKFFKFILCPVIGKKTFQPVFEALNFLSIRGMNFMVSGVKQSGEINVIKYVFEKSGRTEDKHPFIIFDVGANVGNWTIPCLKYCREHACLYSFEPLRKTFDELRDNITRYFADLAEDRIFLFNFGFSDKEQTSVMHYNPVCSGMASLYKRRLEHSGLTSNHQEEVKLKTIDRFCEEHGISKIHFLKLDVEGHEMNVLEGASGLINKNAIDFIQFEFGGCNIDSRTFFQDFFYYLNPNYRIYRICKDGLREIKVYKEQYEIFTTINYLAVKRPIG